MQTIAINGEKRQELGKKSTKAIRNNDGVPCVIYGGKENVHFSAKTSEFRHLIYTPEFKLAQINVGGASHTAVLKDVQFHPVTERVMHIDFVELVDGKLVKLELPIRLEGQAEGVKEGGALMTKMRKLKVETTPEKLVDHVAVDVTALKLGDSIRVRDIEGLDGVAILNPAGNPIASVEVPRALRSAEAEEAATAVTEETPAEAESEA